MQKIYLVTQIITRPFQWDFQESDLLTFSVLLYVYNDGKGLQIAITHWEFTVS